MKQIELTDKEKTVFYGLVKYPSSTDKHLSKKLNLKHSTVTSIRSRLRKSKYFRSLNIPRLQNMGCNLLVAIYTSFSPLTPLEERIKITGKTIEVFEEIFFSAGEQDKGFSLSLAKDYASIGRINDIRTRTFGRHGFLEKEYPHMIIFPFEIGRLYRFFDFSYLLKKSFGLDFENNTPIENIGYQSVKSFSLTNTEKNIYCALIKYPEMSNKDLGLKLGFSRHTISRARGFFEDNNLIRRVNLPNFKKLGFEILSFSHIRFDPHNPPNIKKNEAALLMGDSTIFMASREFEALMLSIHSNYDDYNKDRTRVTQILKENNWISSNPIILTYSLNSLIFIKDFEFAPITKKIVGCNLQF